MVEFKTKRIDFRFHYSKSTGVSQIVCVLVIESELLTKIRKHKSHITLAEKFLLKKNVHKSKIIINK